MSTPMSLYPTDRQPNKPTMNRERTIDAGFIYGQWEAQIKECGELLHDKPGTDSLRLIIVVVNDGMEEKFVATLVDKSESDKNDPNDPNPKKFGTSITEAGAPEGSDMDAVESLLGLLQYKVGKRFQGKIPRDPELATVAEKSLGGTPSARSVTGQRRAHGGITIGLSFDNVPKI
ncbi:hypothetical protein BU26DRAFT_566245 [Trematosphaeria pertusa]|uniref:Uncharacterized protein n=1 Tax=Trematosphaeria pertusa TaxID=390896 RepID=A0A6A6IA53_9PLEO|nr:uncharacterized protein BU26DRAFT_566245 [Trematosphaeria pertusa]KAF2247261.1 hypothetical protein BU26DRAFT_566245 [Trematosphaeria pertusa]